VCYVYESAYRADAQQTINQKRIHHVCLSMIGHSLNCAVAAPGVVVT
jgi:hypothetical protein